MNRKAYGQESTNLGQSRTSFLIEDILYRQKSDDDTESDNLYPNFHVNNNNNNSKLSARPPEGHVRAFHAPQKMQEPSRKSQDTGGLYGSNNPKEFGTPQGYFQTNLMQGGGGGMQGFQAPESGYIQVMGALGAYLGTPYKNMGDPYFLTQGNGTL